MRAPIPFDLDLTVRSHGFYDLSPWLYDADRRILSRPLRLSDGRVVVAEVKAGGAQAPLAVRIAAAGAISGEEAAEARDQLRACLALDEDLDAFYRLIGELAGAQRRDRSEADRRSRRLPSLAWAVQRGAGRLLRSPTVFEDAVKTLCTTNCSWALTRSMTSKLVEHVGEPGPGGCRAFPTPEAMAARPEPFYREVIRAGYRAGALRTIACDVASGALPVERWRDPDVPTDVLGDAIHALPGFGPYATGHLLRLLGRYDHLALDAWTRAKLTRLRRCRRVPSDAAFERWYEPYGKFAGLAMWLEVTADWHGPEPTWP